MNLFLTALWLFLPAGAANMAPVIASKLPGLKRWQTPLHEPWFGRNKTWRGLVAGIVAATIVVGIQKHLFLDTTWAIDISWVDYWSPRAWLLGPLLGGGALLGDAVESFFKRKRGVPAGHSWFPFDQIDYIIGALTLTAPFTHPSLALVGAIFAIYFGLHLLTVYVFYLCGIRERPI